jgi:hypothetical protein
MVLDESPADVLEVWYWSVFTEAAPGEGESSGLLLEKSELLEKAPAPEYCSVAASSTLLLAAELC